MQAAITSGRDEVADINALSMLTSASPLRVTKRRHLLLALGVAGRVGAAAWMKPQDRTCTDSLLPAF